MKTANEIQQHLVRCSTSLESYQSTVRLLKGLNCSIADDMISAEREVAVNDLAALYTLLHVLFQPEPSNTVQMAESFYQTFY